MTIFNFYCTREYTTFRGMKDTAFSKRQVAINVDHYSHNLERQNAKIQYDKARQELINDGYTILLVTETYVGDWLATDCNENVFDGDFNNI